MMQTSGSETSMEGFKVQRLQRQLQRRDRELETAKRQIQELQAELHALNVQKEELRQALAVAQHPVDGYRKDWTWVRKIVFVLENAKRPMRSPEMIEELAKREEHLRNHWNQAQFFSAFLNKALKEERIMREKKRGERGFYYQLPPLSANE